MLVFGIMLLMTTCVLAQAGAEGQGKKTAGEKKTGSAEQALLDIEWVQAGKKQDPAMLRA